jgi:hypothetical protein
MVVQVDKWREWKRQKWLGGQVQRVEETKVVRWTSAESGRDKAV